MKKPTEAERFTQAFNTVLQDDPQTAPGPTAINRELGNPPPHNMLAGRLSKLRRRLLEEAGFVQAEKGARWHRP